MAVYDEKEQNLIIKYKQKQARKNLASQYVQNRKAKKMSQQQVADLIGVKRPNITRFENGTYNPTLDMLVKIAEALDMELEIKLKNKKKKAE